jgi:long-subunit acyl-CoA synthetase (AMP-forming)
MHYAITTVGFYDAMGVEQVDYILNQTELTTIVCAGQYAEKLIKMKSKSMASKVTALILMDGETIEQSSRDLAS